MIRNRIEKSLRKPSVLRIFSYSLTLILGAITKIPNLTMQYVHYDRDIVQAHGVKLIGWTHPTFCTPSNLGSNEGHLITLNNALVSGACRWVSVNQEGRADHAEEWAERLRNGEVRAPKVRQPRKDKGTKRAKCARDDQDAEDDRCGDQSQLPSARAGGRCSQKSKQARPPNNDTDFPRTKRRRITSAPIILDSDEDELGGNGSNDDNSSGTGGE